MAFSAFKCVVSLLCALYVVLIVGLFTAGALSIAADNYYDSIKPSYITEYFAGKNTDSFEVLTVTAAIIAFISAGVSLVLFIILVLILIRIFQGEYVQGTLDNLAGKIRNLGSLPRKELVILEDEEDADSGTGSQRATLMPEPQNLCLFPWRKRSPRPSIVSGIPSTRTSSESDSDSGKKSVKPSAKDGDGGHHHPHGHGGLEIGPRDEEGSEKKHDKQERSDWKLVGLASEPASSTGGVSHVGNEHKHQGKKSKREKGHHGKRESRKSKSKSRRAGRSSRRRSGLVSSADRHFAYCGNPNCNQCFDGYHSLDCPGCPSCPGGRPQRRESNLPPGQQQQQQLQPYQDLASLPFETPGSFNPNQPYPPDGRNQPQRVPPDRR